VQKKCGKLEEEYTEAILMELFEKYLIETKKCKKLVLKNYAQLETAVKVALAHPESLQQLEEVQVDFIVRNNDYGEIYLVAITICVV
jgi:hypothetical protein